MTRLRSLGAWLARYRWAITSTLFAVSLALPGLHLVDGDAVFGWRLLLTAWYGILILELAWLANPIFLAGLILLLRGHDRAAGIMGISAFAVGLLSLRSRIWIANHTHIEDLGAGFLVWMAAFAVMGLAILAAPAKSGPRTEMEAS